eukprot:5058265-Prymnesium_polylepis.1
MHRARTREIDTWDPRRDLPSTLALSGRRWHGVLSEVKRFVCFVRMWTETAERASETAGFAGAGCTTCAPQRGALRYGVGGSLR